MSRQWQLEGGVEHQDFDCKPGLFCSVLIVKVVLCFQGDGSVGSCFSSSFQFKQILPCDL